MLTRFLHRFLRRFPPAFLLVAGALWPVMASANLCPGEMDVKLPKPEQTPPGWDKLVHSTKPPLTKVQLFDGPPDAAPEIKPKTHQNRRIHWEFRIASKQGPVSAASGFAANKPAGSAVTLPSDTSPPSVATATSDADGNANPETAAPVRPLWIKCSYGAPPITLLRPLPADFSACTLKCEHGCQLWCQ